VTGQSPFQHNIDLHQLLKIMKQEIIYYLFLFYLSSLKLNFFILKIIIYFFLFFFYIIFYVHMLYNELHLLVLWNFLLHTPHKYILLNKYLVILRFHRLMDHFFFFKKLNLLHWCVNRYHRTYRRKT
jgi:hypothetical protein